MATSQHMAVRAAIAELFAVEPALADGGIFENDDVAMPVDKSQQIHVDRVTSDPFEGPITGSPIDWDTEIDLTFKARKGNDLRADVVCDQLWTDAFARLMANQQLGGLAQQIKPGAVEFDQDRTDGNVAEIKQRITVVHRTTSNSIS